MTLATATKLSLLKVFVTSTLNTTMAMACTDGWSSAHAMHTKYAETPLKPTRCIENKLAELLAVNNTVCGVQLRPTGT